MCEPISATTALYLSAAASAATAVVGYVQAEEAADAQEKAIKENYNQQMQTVNEQYRQTNAAATQQMSERAQEAAKEMARARVIAGESGALGGVSDVRIMNEIKSAESADMATIEANRKNNLNQTHLEAQALRATGKGQISQIKQPSLIGSGLQIAGIYADAQTKQKSLNKQKA